MKESHTGIELTTDELRKITEYAVVWATKALPIFEQHNPNDTRPREAIKAASQFYENGKRSNALRMSGLAAYRASREAHDPAAIEAALAATQAVGAAYLHPIASSLQVEHILGSIVHAAYALELEAEDANTARIECGKALQDAPRELIAVLRRYPAAPSKKGRAGELLQYLDSKLRSR